MAPVFKGADRLWCSAVLYFILGWGAISLFYVGWILPSGSKPRSWTARVSDAPGPAEAPSHIKPPAYFRSMPPAPPRFIGGPVAFDAPLSSPPPSFDPMARRTGLVLILDDLGIDPAVDLAALRLPRAVVFSILPYGRDARDLAQRACAQGRMVLIHLPMEPLDPSHNPGPRFIRSGMSKDTVQTIVARAYRQVPCAVGLNQHMGSKVSRDLRTMRWVARAARDVGIAFLVDSRTIDHSRLCEAAAIEGIPCYQRNVFLDADRSPGSMTVRWREAHRLLSRRKRSILIAHPRPSTLRFLALHLQWTDKNLRVAMENKTNVPSRPISSQSVISDRYSAVSYSSTR